MTSKKLKVTEHYQYHTPDTLSPRTVVPLPFEQFRAWFAEAVEGKKVQEPEAMVLATATQRGVPSARVVLFKELDQRGFVFYTNYGSRKSQEMAENAHAALVFYWREVHRSVRVVGTVEKVSREQSEEYFASRPLGSRLGAWASRQSAVVEEGELHTRLKEMEKRFGSHEAADVPLPDFWGGWRVVPSEIEFWCGKPSRLHDRVRYLRTDAPDEASPSWKIERLAP